jgi:hypothetical protein
VVLSLSSRIYQKQTASPSLLLLLLRWLPSLEELEDPITTISVDFRYRNVQYVDSCVQGPQMTVLSSRCCFRNKTRRDSYYSSSGSVRRHGVQSVRMLRLVVVVVLSLVSQLLAESTVVEATTQYLSGCSNDSSKLAIQKVLGCRGGGGRRGGFFSMIVPMTAAEQYRQTLEEQVFLMDKQLRQARDELTVLRDQWSRKTAPPPDDSAKPSKSEVAALKQHVAILTSQVTELTKMKDELLSMLEVEQAQVVALEEALKREKDLTKELQESYEEQLRELHLQLEQKASQQLDDLKRLMEQRVDQAAEAARKAAEKMVQEHIEMATNQMRLEQQRELAAERRRSDQAVEVERRKMRKLVKALAIRERKLLGKRQPDALDLEDAAAQQRQEQSSLGRSTITSQPPKKPPTSWGPMR